MTQTQTQLQAENKVEITTAVKEKELNNLQNIIEEKKSTWLVVKKLEPNEKAEIEETFKNVKDFRQLWEKITAPIDQIIEKTSKIIESDPIMDVSKELAEVNNEVNSVYKEIINDDWVVMKFLKSIPVIWTLAEKIDNSVDDIKFNMKSIQWKIEQIFSWFDTSYNSLVKSIEMQKEFLEGLEQNIWKVKAYKEYVEEKLKEFEEKYKQVENEEEKQKYKMFIDNVKFFLWNLEVLIWNLELARKRLLIRLDSATKLALAMQSSRPIFKTLLSVAILETSWQKALDASTKAIQIMGSTIDKMSSELTDKAIQSSKKAEELASKPVLDPKVFVENVKKLKQHFEEIEQYREQVRQEAEKEREIFKQASEELAKLKEVKSKDYDELKENLKM